jgi:two-component sensor histidine kinase/PAS domain-containing protein
MHVSNLLPVNAPFDALLHDAPLGVYLLDENLHIRQANLVAINVLGASRNLIGQGFDEVVRFVWPEPYASEIVQRIRTTLETGKPYISHDRNTECLDGVPNDCYAWQINRVLLQDGSLGVVCYFRDISEQVVAREEIEETKKESRKAAEGLRAIAARARCVLWYADVQDRGDRHLHWDLRVADEEAARRFLPLNMPPGHDHGRAIAEARLPEDRARMIWGDDEIRAGRSYQQEFRIRDVEGNIRWLAEDVQIESVGQNHWYAVGICVDITERKRAEQERANHLAEIESLNSRLQRAMAETHHRVKNNLQVISALVDMQNMKHEDEVPASELVRIAQHIRALATIHDLLTAHAKMDTETDTLHSAAIMDKLMPLLQDLAGKRKLSVSAQDIVLPMRQATSLAVLVNELVSNAVKHGGTEIDVTLSQDRGKAQLVVTDDGPGFPDGFDPEKAANTGLELIDSLSRLDLHGTTAFQNRPDGGARVVVEFPLPTST